MPSETEGDKSANHSTAGNQAKADPFCNFPTQKIKHIYASSTKLVQILNNKFGKGGYDVYLAHNRYCIRAPRNLTPGEIEQCRRYATFLDVPNPAAHYIPKPPHASLDPEICDRTVYSEDVIDTVEYGYTINEGLLDNDTYVFRTNYSSSPPMALEYYSNLTVSKWGSAALADFIDLTLTIDVRRLNGDSTTAVELKAAGGSYSIFPGIPLDMSPTFEAMALSLTGAVRSYRHDESTLQVVKGQAFTEVPLLQVLSRLASGSVRNNLRTATN
ncbi:hypothetical protein F4808DRAFT_471117 [Astrocystis sublimbata]|nr:hypothetical protein F4808DRAFT_471117 [Astrocystis sublimbata]